jgi:anti-anti-sigma factor
MSAVYGAAAIRSPVPGRISGYADGVERPDLTIAVAHGPGEATVSLSGEIDMSTVARLSKVVGDLLNTAELASPTPPRVVLDMAGVTFCDSQGLGTLVVLSRKATMAQSCLVLVNVGDFLLRVLDITGLRGALMIQESAA